MPTSSLTPIIIYKEFTLLLLSGHGFIFLQSIQYPPCKKKKKMQVGANPIRQNLPPATIKTNILIAINLSRTESPSG